MAAKTWRLVVTELGGQSPIHEVTVEAANWMSALQTGRSQIGEDGGVPTGASCAVAPDGKVTIHDPMARRTYVLTPDASTSYRRASPQGPRVPAEEVPRKDSQPAAAQAPPDAPRVSNKTVAYAMPAAAPTAEVAVGQARPEAAQPAPAERRPASQPAPAEQRPAPAPAEQQPASQPAPPNEPAVQISTEADWQLLSQRGEDPTPSSPLTYRERTYVVAPETTPERAEQILRSRFEELRAELGAVPAGKFLNLAAFDHRWEGKPQRPPVATLQWKDWRGDPEVAFPLSKRQAKAHPVQPAAPARPAPSAPAQAAPAQPAAHAPQAAPAQPAPAQPAAGAPQPAQDPQATAPRRRKRTSTSEQDARLAHAFEASQDLFFLSSPAEGLDFVVRLLGELIPSEAMSACLYDINTDEFRFVALDGPGADERRGEAIPSTSGILGGASQRVGAPTRIPDCTVDQRFDPGVDGRVGLEARNAMYMALTHQGRLLGMLQLVNRRDKPEFSTSDADVVAYVGKQLSEFLYQARIAPDQASGGR